MRYQGHCKWIRVFGKRDGHNWTKMFDSMTECAEWLGVSLYTLRKWRYEARRKGIAANGMSFWEGY